MLKEHNYMNNRKNGFGISPLMQELMVYAGHLECYEKCNEVLERFLSVEVSSSQVYRVTDSLSEELADKIDPDERILEPLEKEDILYAELDGSMLHLRDEGWKEVKLLRLFKGSDCLNPGSDSSYLVSSHYAAHLGSHCDFCEIAERAIDSYGYRKSDLVFITDGASWIKNWIEDYYPQAHAVLDYFHVCEHLYEFAENCFKNTPEIKAQWCEEQKDLLLESQVETVLENIGKTGAKVKDKEKLIRYYRNNISRMDYKFYRSIGCGIIGSGAIESAHRTVIQKRMKLSGQHWTRKGAENMLRLRVVSMNKQWNKVVNLLKNAKSKAA